MICKICLKDAESLTRRGRCKDCISLLLVCACGKKKNPGDSICPSCKMEKSSKGRRSIQVVSKRPKSNSVSPIRHTKSDNTRNIHEDQVAYGRRMMQMEGVR